MSDDVPSSGTVTRADLVGEVVALGHSVRRSEELVDAVFACIGECLAQGGDVRINGFGRFEVRHRAGRIGRNVRTGEAVEVAPAATVAFRSASAVDRELTRSLGGRP